MPIESESDKSEGRTCQRSRKPLAFGSAQFIDHLHVQASAAIVILSADVQYFVLVPPVAPRRGWLDSFCAPAQRKLQHELLALDVETIASAPADVAAPSPIAELFEPAHVAPATGRVRGADISA